MGIAVLLLLRASDEVSPIVSPAERTQLGPNGALSDTPDPGICWWRKPVTEGPTVPKRLAIVIVGFALIVAACGGDDDGSQVASLENETSTIIIGASL